MIQRFASSLALNVHFHSLVLDGVYVPAQNGGPPVFHRLAVSEMDVRLAVEMERLAATFDAGRRAAEGARVVLLGPVNAGKSTLFNALLGHERAIVSPQPGTTRDVVSEAVDWHGVALRLEDTAGGRVAQDPVERQGIERSLRAGSAAALRLEGRGGCAGRWPSASPPGSPGT